MKQVKLFPAPHVEVRIHVSDQMEEDIRKCRELARNEKGGGMDCDQCSWNRIEWDSTGMCELPAVYEQLEERVIGTLDGRDSR